MIGASRRGDADGKPFRHVVDGNCRNDKGDIGLQAAAFEAAIFYGEDLVPGDRISGPAIIEEPTTTLVIYPGATAVVSAYGHYLCELA